MYGYDGCGLGCVYVKSLIGDFEKLEKGFGGEKSVLGGVEALRACG